MIEATLSKRYARALLELAKERGVVEKYLKDLKDLDLVLHTHVALQNALKNPFFEPNQRIRVMASISAKMEFDTILSNFVKYLTKKGRMSLFSEITKAFQSLYFQSAGCLEASITTAKKMDDSFYQQIVTILEKKMAKKVTYLAKVDPTVIGGVAVELDGRIYDGTIVADLNKIEGRLKNLATL